MHSERQIDKMPLKYTTLAIGVNVARNAYTWNIPNLMRLTVGLGAIADLSELIGGPGVSKNEVILFTRITYGSRIYFQQADIYYINDPDWWHYTKEPLNNSENIDGRKYELKNE